MPAIVTDAPTAPDVGVRLEIVGAAAATADSDRRNIKRTIDRNAHKAVAPEFQVPDERPNARVWVKAELAETRRDRNELHGIANSFVSVSARSNTAERLGELFVQLESFGPRRLTAGTEKDDAADDAQCVEHEPGSFS